MLRSSEELNKPVDPTDEAVQFYKDSMPHEDWITFDYANLRGGDLPSNETAVWGFELVVSLTVAVPEVKLRLHHGLREHDISVGSGVALRRLFLIRCIYQDFARLGDYFLHLLTPTGDAKPYAIEPFMLRLSHSQLGGSRAGGSSIMSLSSSSSSSSSSTPMPRSDTRLSIHASVTQDDSETKRAVAPKRSERISACFSCNALKPYTILKQCPVCKIGLYCGSECFERGHSHNIDPCITGRALIAALPLATATAEEDGLLCRDNLFASEMVRGMRYHKVNVLDVFGYGRKETTEETKRKANAALRIIGINLSRNPLYYHPKSAVYGGASLRVVRDQEVIWHCGTQLMLEDKTHVSGVPATVTGGALVGVAISALLMRSAENMPEHAILLELGI